MSPSAALPTPDTPSKDAVRTCSACGRLLIPGQTVCACGTAVALHPRAERPPFDFGKLLPFVPLAGSLVLFYLIFNPILVMYTIMPVLKITAVTFLASAAVALIVADRARRQEWLYAASPFSRLSPASWFVGVLLVWPVFYPAFLYAHYKITNRARMIFGFITGVLFMIALLWLLLVGRNQLPQWPVQQAPVTGTPSITPVPANQGPLENPPTLQANYPIVLPPATSPTPTGGMLSPFPAVTGESAQSESASGEAPPNNSSSPPSPAPVPRPPTAQPATAPANSSGNSIPLLSVEIIKRGAAQ